MNWTTSYTGTGLAATITMPANGTYTFRVKATKTGYADSGYTYGKNTCAVILTCSAPMSLTVPATNTTESFYVRWGSSSTSGVTYELYNSTDGVNWTAAYSGANISSNVTVTANGTYSFRVKAVKAGYVDSAYTTSSTSCAVTFTCGAPTSLAVPATNTTGSIYVRWGSSSTSGVTYELDYSTDGVNWTVAYSGANISSNVTVANGTYSFRVKAAKTGYADSAYTTSITSCIVTK